MAELQLKSNRFRTEREGDWRRLARLLEKVERGSTASLTPAELIEIPVLYRATLSSLSVARSISLDQSLVEYLESLSTRAYFLVYGARAGLWERIARFFAHDWPVAVRGVWRETLVSAAIMVLGGVVAFVLVGQDPDWFYSFIPRELAAGRDPTATAAALKATLYDAPKAGEGGLSVLATFLFTHNASISILAFALGFAFGVPTAALMLSNGCMMGAFMALFASRGLGFEATGWLMIHGTTELFAVILAGAAGFSIGWAVAFPGRLSRVEAAAVAGKRAGAVMVGVVIMLIVAGALEGFARQLVTNDLVRYAVAATALLTWLAYFYLPRRSLARG
jgi:uncharacterized membrane protein SpoIIM required for sporulation